MKIYNIQSYELTKLNYVDGRSENSYCTTNTNITTGDIVIVNYDVTSDDVYRVTSIDPSHETGIKITLNKHHKFTAEEFTKAMCELKAEQDEDNLDEEIGHRDADWLLVLALRGVSKEYKKGCDAFDELKKWYA